MDKETIRKWIYGNERGMRFLCYFNLIIFSCATLLLLWVGSTVMNESNSLIEDTAGGMIIVLALVMLLIANGQLDALWSMKIEKRLKALEELHRTEMMARAMVDMSIGLATGIAVLEGVAEQERKKKYELVRCEYCRKLWKLYRHNRELQTAYCSSCKGQRKIKKLGWYEKGDEKK